MSGDKTMKKYLVTFKKEFEANELHEVYGQVLDYIDYCHEYGDVNCFDAEVITVEKDNEYSNG